MKVIYIKDVKGHGKKGDIKTEKDGYAKNFLITNGYAVQLNEQNLQKLEEEKEEAKKQDEAMKEQAKELKNKLEKITIEFKVKTGKEDKVFGSISPKQIKEELEKQNIIIDKKQIIEKEPLTSLGIHVVKIELYKEIFAKVKVSLIKE